MEEMCGGCWYALSSGLLGDMLADLAVGNGTDTIHQRFSLSRAAWPQRRGLTRPVSLRR